MERSHPSALWPKDGLSFLVLAGIVAVVVGLDQLSKAWVTAWLPEGHWWSPWSGEAAEVFRITHVTNTGAAFGLFPNHGSFFILIAVIVVIAIVLYYHRLPAEDWLVRISLGLQLGGAMGNLIDRLRFGYVIDFIDISFWPVFNLADASITAGVLLIIYQLWRTERAKVSSQHTQVDKEVRL
ncbi:MAG: signal peptidase II [Anaerolineae bacterium]|nr:signal peptidase II [Anaerolineae bacterium]MDW8071916.1 signal peptidase II [Anaerolineae bacterium]